jgi:hypothetical protein
MRRVLHEGQMPRPLREKATRKSWPHSGQRARAKPIGQDAALPIAPELALHVARYRVPIAFTRQREVGRQVAESSKSGADCSERIWRNNLGDNTRDFKLQTIWPPLAGGPAPVGTAPGAGVGGRYPQAARRAAGWGVASPLRLGGCS